MYYFYGKSNRGHGICPLYRGCPLLGESVIRSFTVVYSEIFEHTLILFKVQVKLLATTVKFQADTSKSVSKILCPKIRNQNVDYDEKADTVGHGLGRGPQCKPSAHVQKVYNAEHVLCYVNKRDPVDARSGIIFIRKVRTRGGKAPSNCMFHACPLNIAFNGNGNNIVIPQLSTIVDR